MNIFNFISILFIILLVIAIIIIKKKLDIINRIDRFDRPSLNIDINNIILGLSLLSFLIGCIFTIIMLCV